MILETIHSPADVKALDRSELPVLCGELRRTQAGKPARALKCAEPH